VALAATALAGDDDGFAPTGELGMVIVSKDGAETRVSDGQTVDRGAEAAFTVQADGASYLYLLQIPKDGDATVLLPLTGLTWIASEGTMRVIPQPSSARPEDDLLSVWKPESDGRLEFVLIAAPAPRDVPQDSRTPTLESFLLPPAHIEGPQAGPAVVLDRMVVTFES
jgi:hypothetical protein